MKRVTKAVGVLCLVAFAVMNSQSAVAADSNWYLGGNGGSTKTKIDDARIASSLEAGGFATTAITNDQRRTGYKLFAGYRFDKYFALEGGYYNLGRSSFTATTVPTGTLIGNIKLKGYNLDAVVILPIVEKFSAFGRLGFIYSQATDTFIGTGAVMVTNPTPSKGYPSYKFGAGLQYDFIKFLGLRVEAERYRINDAVGNKGDVDFYSAGLVVKF
jgi:OmpA-OmpF porin, OOP family